MRSAALESPRFEPVLVYAATPGRGPVRCAVLAMLAAAPLALGAAYPVAYVPLLVAAFAVGIFSLYREWHLRASGVVMPDVPGHRGLLALLALVAIQMVPLPPALLSWVSPGSYWFYNEPLLLPLTDWKPITANPADTARGFVFLAGMALLYVSVYREFDHPVWKRRLAKTVVGVGFVMTFEALVQEAYSARVIYGLYRPPWDWAVFGPYVNRNLFAGYMLMAVPLAAGLAAEALEDLRRVWRRRRQGWLALGDPEGSAFFSRAAVAMVLVVGLLATRSRGAMVGLAVWAIVMPLVSRHRRLTAFAVLLVAGLGLAWFGLEAQQQAFLARGGFRDSVRFLIWQDSLKMVPAHPVFGSGFNAFGTAHPPRQTVFPTEWIGMTHNEYLQALVDLGIIGFAITMALVFRLLVNGRRTAGQGSFQASLFGSVVAVLAHNLVDMNWQLAANTATFVALAGIVVQAPFVAPARSGGGEGNHPRRGREARDPAP
jgi:O-antigen ligase